jgi:hypothetical protein
MRKAMGSILSISAPPPPKRKGKKLSLFDNKNASNLQYWKKNLQITSIYMPFFLTGK